MEPSKTALAINETYVKGCRAYGFHKTSAPWAFNANEKAYYGPILSVLRLPSESASKNAFVA